MLEAVAAPVAVRTTGLTGLLEAQPPSEQLSAHTGAGQALRALLPPLRTLVGQVGAQGRPGTLVPLARLLGAFLVGPLAQCLRVPLEVGARALRPPSGPTTVGVEAVLLLLLRE